MKNAILLPFVSLLWISCSETDPPATQNCSHSTVCTEELRTLSMQVIYPDSTPVALDDFQVFLLPEGKDITRSKSQERMKWFRSSGNYPIIGDTYKEYFPRYVPIHLLFKGYQGGRLVVSTEVFTTFDCCHVAWISGKRVLVVEPGEKKQ